MMRGPKWGLFDVINFTLFLLVLFVGVPLAMARLSLGLGIAVFVVEVLIVAIYEAGLVERYRAALAEMLPGEYTDDWEQENL